MDREQIRGRNDDRLAAEMRVIVCGGRKYTDVETVAFELGTLQPDAVLVHGCASGADHIAEAIWSNRFRKTEGHHADWGRYGKAAGPRRNQEMIDAGADLVIAFPGGKGTADMVARARKAGITVRVVPA